MGRPAFEITEDHLRQIEALSGLGLTEASIAHVIGVAPRTFRDIKTRDERVTAALEKGKAEAETVIAKALFLKAKAGELGAICWWEKTRAGRSERQILAHENAAPIEIVRRIKRDDGDSTPD